MQNGCRGAPTRTRAARRRERPTRLRTLPATVPAQQGPRRATPRRAVSLRQFAEGVAVAPHDVARDVHLAGEIRTRRRHAQRAVGSIRHADGVAFLDIEVDERFLRQYDANRVADLAELELEDHAISVATNVITFKRRQDLSAGPPSNSVGPFQLWKSTLDTRCPVQGCSRMECRSSGSGLEWRTLSTSNR